MDGITGDPAFLLSILKGGLAMISHARFEGFLTLLYSNLNGLHVLDVTVTVTTLPEKWFQHFLRVKYSK